MGVIDELARGSPVVQENIESVASEVSLRGLPDLLENLPHLGQKVSRNLRKAGIVGLGNDESVSLAHRIDVEESEDPLVLENFGGRDLAADDLAEDTVFHGSLLLNFLARTGKGGE